MEFVAICSTPIGNQHKHIDKNSLKNHHPWASGHTGNGKLVNLLGSPRKNQLHQFLFLGHLSLHSDCILSVWRTSGPVWMILNKKEESGGRWTLSGDGGQGLPGLLGNWDRCALHRGDTKTPDLPRRKQRLSNFPKFRQVRFYSNPLCLKVLAVINSATWLRRKEGWRLTPSDPMTTHVCHQPPW